MANQFTDEEEKLIQNSRRIVTEDSEIFNTAKPPAALNWCTIVPPLLQQVPDKICAYTLRYITQMLDEGLQVGRKPCEGGLTPVLCYEDITLYTQTSSEVADLKWDLWAGWEKGTTRFWFGIENYDLCFTYQGGNVFVIGDYRDELENWYNDVFNQLTGLPSWAGTEHGKSLIFQAIFGIALLLLLLTIANPATVVLGGAVILIGLGAQALGANPIDENTNLNFGV